MTDFMTEYKQKLTTADEAVKLVKSGDNVYIGTCSSVAYALCDALDARSGELEDVTIDSGLMIRPLSLFENPRFHHNAYFMGGYNRAALRGGLGDFTSVHLSQFDIWCNDAAAIDVIFAEVSPPDENGYMNLGTNGTCLIPHMLDHARIVIAQVNKKAAWVYGEHNFIHVSQVAAIVEADDEQAESPNPGFDDTIKTLADNIVREIPDGATIQLGAGRMGTAIGYGLMSKNDLGIHSEMIGDSLMDLMKNGNVNNSRKTFYPGKSVIGFACGTRELYRFLDRNENCWFIPMMEVNNPYNIAKNDNMISVNGAVEIDLTGQVCAETVNGVQYSGIGGQVDYVRGAQMSKGGKSIIATEAVYEKKGERKSRIVAKFGPYTAITTSRADVHYVATEYGCINLKKLPMKQRVRAMISLAAPEFRNDLEAEAKEAGLL